MKYYRIFIVSAIVAGMMFSGCGNSVSIRSDAVISDTHEETSVSCAEESELETAAKEQEQASRDFFAMDTYMTITAYGENSEEAVDAAVEEINHLDELISVGNSESEICQLNTNGSGVLSPPVGYLVERSKEFYESTGGLFDIAIYPIMDEWGFTTQEYKVPDQDTLEQLLALTDVSKISYDNATGEIFFGMDKMQIDLGGITKGYASAEVMQIFKNYGITSGLVSLGGNVQLYRSKTDGSPWRVAIQSPSDDYDYIGILSASDVAVITSGGYERYFEQDGVTYHHIIDPRTGYPSDGGLLSATIVSEDGTLADALSTTLFIMGTEGAIDYWHQSAENFDFILFDENQEIYITEGIADTFESDFPIHVISEN